MMKELHGIDLTLVMPTARRVPGLTILTCVGSNEYKQVEIEINTLTSDILHVSVTKASACFLSLFLSL